MAVADANGWTPTLQLSRAGSTLPGTLVEPELLDAISSIASGTRTLAVYRERWQQVTGPLCVCLWGLRDPGNVGTILRSAAAFGASSVALAGNCADPYSPKAVRASMGAIFEIALARVESVDELPGTRIGLIPHSGESLSDLKIAGEISLIVGGEREGLPASVISECDRVATIPIKTESLNAAMAATIALYELAKRNDD